MNGTIVAPETPQIMNINSSLIVPLVFNLSFRVTLGDRDNTIETLDNLVKILRARKSDIACFEDGKLFMVGTIANNVLGAPQVNAGDFIGRVLSLEDIDTKVRNIFSSLTSAFLTYGMTLAKSGDYWFIEYNSCLYKVYYDSEANKYKIDETFEYHAKSFTKYKVSLSFDSFRIDEPKTLNAKEYCTIALGGSATVVDLHTALGNDLTKVCVAKYKVQAKLPINLDNQLHYLEPLEMPSGLGISGELSQLASHNFNQNKHNDGINPTLSYSFVLNRGESLIEQWYKYARYGVVGTPTDSYATGVTPNTLYRVVEINSYWANIDIVEFLAKATENIDVENTESDALTIKLTFEKQKEE